MERWNVRITLAAPRAVLDAAADPFTPRLATALALPNGCRPMAASVEDFGQVRVVTFDMPPGTVRPTPPGITWTKL